MSEILNLRVYFANAAAFHYTKNYLKFKIGFELGTYYMLSKLGMGSDCLNG